MKYCIILLVLIISCTSGPLQEKINFDAHLLDSVKQKADTIYTRRYRTDEFATADYYVNRRDTTVCQIMKDDSGRVRQVLMVKKSSRLYAAEYFTNGQLKAKMGFDELGRLNGEGTNFYPSGIVRSKGNYRAGLFIGDWKNFDEKGKLQSTDHFDSSGTLQRSTPR